MKVILDQKEIEKLIKDNIDVPRNYDVENVSIIFDINADDVNFISAEVVMEKDEIL